MTNPAPSPAALLDRIERDKRAQDYLNRKRMGRSTWGEKAAMLLICATIAYVGVLVTDCARQAAVDMVEAGE